MPGTKILCSLWTIVNLSLGILVFNSYSLFYSPPSLVLCLTHRQTCSLTCFFLSLSLGHVCAHMLFLLSELLCLSISIFDLSRAVSYCDIVLPQSHPHLGSWNFLYCIHLFSFGCTYFLSWLSLFVTLNLPFLASVDSHWNLNSICCIHLLQFLFFVLFNLLVF